MGGKKMGRKNMGKKKLGTGNEVKLWRQTLLMN